MRNLISSRLLRMMKRLQLRGSARSPGAGHWPEFDPWYSSRTPATDPYLSTPAGGEGIWPTLPRSLSGDQGAHLRIRNLMNSRRGHEDYLRISFFFVANIRINIISNRIEINNTTICLNLYLFVLSKKKKELAIAESLQFSHRVSNESLLSIKKMSTKHLKLSMQA